MKRILSFFLIFIVMEALLSGCSPQSIPQTNDSLTIYFTKRGNNENDPVVPLDVYAKEMISRFKQDHFELEIKVYDPTNGDITMTEEQQEQIFSNDMMAGKGPDVIVTDSTIRTYKMMKSGMFLDMLPMINADSSFDPENYQQVMLDAGKLDGKQYILPVSCSVPYLLTTKDTLGSSGFPVSSCDNSQNYVQEALRMMEQGMRIDSGTSEDRITYTGWATDLVDYTFASLNLDTSEFRSFQELQKAVYQYDHQSDRRPVKKRTIASVIQKEALFFPTGGNLVSTTGAMQRCAHYSTPVAILAKNSDGQVVGTVKKLRRLGLLAPISNSHMNLLGL